MADVIDDVLFNDDQEASEPVDTRQAKHSLKEMKSLMKELESFDSIVNILTQLSAEFVAEEGQKKFDLCQKIGDLLTTYSVCCKVGETDFEWQKNLSTGLFQIIKNRLSKEQRGSAYRLVSVLCHEFGGLNWMSADSTWSEQEIKFFTLLSRLVCIEIVIGLDAKPVDSNLLGSCCIILENIILTLVDEDRSEKIICGLGPDDTYNQIKAIRETMSTVMEYLENVRQTWSAESTPEEETIVILALTRLLCSWISEETDILSEQIRNLIPFILKLLDTVHAEKSPNFQHIVVTALHSLVSDDATLTVIRSAATNLNIKLNACRECNQDADLCKSLLELLGDKVL